jgi:hypothetical protein
MLRYVLAAVTLSIIAPGIHRGADADTSPPRALSKAVVADGSVFTVRANRFGGTLFWARLNGMASGRCELPATAGRPVPTRWGIAFGRFWDSESFGHLPDSWQRNNYLECYHLADLLRGEIGEGPITAPGINARGFWFLSAQPLGMSNVFLPAGLHYDYLPTSQDSVRMFVLEGYHGNSPPYPVKWTFSVHRYQGKWSAGHRRWEEGTWTEEESLPHPFTESFHVYAFGDRYAFLTDSGKVYVRDDLQARQG